MKVLVTGAKGMLGQDLCPVLEDVGMFVIETDIDNLDITDEEMTKEVITKTTPYTPDDNTSPVNKYGLTKLRGEEEVKKYCEKYYIARTSWLYGHHGKNFVETMLSLAQQNKELKVVDDQIGCPTWTVELANGILKLLSQPYGIYHVCGSGSVSWYGFAEEIFKQSGLTVDLKPCTTEDFPRPAKRPRYSVMDNKGLCRNWQAALQDYLQLRDV